MYYTLAQPQSKNRVTQEFGARPEFYAKFGLKAHEGLDLNDTPGTPTPVYAVEGGSVVTRTDGAYGKRCDVYNQDLMLLFSYCHLSKFEVKTKDVVKAGDLIGYTGNTSTYKMPIHLHLMVKEIDENLEIKNLRNGYAGSISCGVKDNLFYIDADIKYKGLQVITSEEEHITPANALYRLERNGGPYIVLFPPYHTRTPLQKLSILEHEYNHYVFFEKMNRRDMANWMNVSNFSGTQKASAIAKGYLKNEYLNWNAERNIWEDMAECIEDFIINPDKKYGNYIDVKRAVASRLHGKYTGDYK